MDVRGVRGRAQGKKPEIARVKVLWQEEAWGELWKWKGSVDRGEIAFGQ